MQAVLRFREDKLMCVLSDATLHERLHELIKEPDHALVNPASVDIRIGQFLKYEQDSQWDLVTDGPYIMAPKEFVLVSTYEHLMVPRDLVIELKLKSSRAREGFDHSMAFHFDPGWDGIGTLEVHNMNRYASLELSYGLRFAQLIVHKLDRPVVSAYDGRYQHATSVEAAK